jgi:regulatory protein
MPRNEDLSAPMTHPRPPRAPAKSSPLTRERLEAAALAYLERSDSSVENLRRVLMRRVERAARRDAADRGQARLWVAAVIDKVAALGLVDDRRYAEARGMTLRRAGRSARPIRLGLAGKGVAPEAIDAAMARAEEDPGAAERAAAIAFARRRRLGPYQPEGERAAMRQRDLAAMSRAGFGYDLVRGVLLARSVEDLESELGLASR